jgi:hypothetical protein
LIIDKILPTVQWYGREAADVKHFGSWLTNPDAKNYPYDRLLAQFCGRLGISEKGIAQYWQDPVIEVGQTGHPLKFVDQPSFKLVDDPARYLPGYRPKVTTGKAKTKAKSKGKGKSKGKKQRVRLKGRCRETLIGFWRRGLWLDLNTALLVTARVFRFEGLPQDQAAGLLHSYTRALPDDASSRIRDNKWKEIDYEIGRVLTKAYADHDPTLSDPEALTKLQGAVSVWSKAGFLLHDKHTWHRTPRSDTVGILDLIDILGEIPRWAWSARDAAEITATLGKVFSRKNRHKAPEIALQLVRLVTHQYHEGNGCSVEYLQAFLWNNFHIAYKDTALWKVMSAAKALNLIAVLVGPRPGRATTYGPGLRALPYLPQYLDYLKGEPCQITTMTLREQVARSHLGARRS